VSFEVVMAKMMMMFSVVMLCGAQPIMFCYVCFFTEPELGFSIFKTGQED
jgi:hypothetical protein